MREFKQWPERKQRSLYQHLKGTNLFWSPKGKRKENKNGEHYTVYSPKAETKAK